MPTHPVRQHWTTKWKFKSVFFLSLITFSRLSQFRRNFFISFRRPLHRRTTKSGKKIRLEFTRKNGRGSQWYRNSNEINLRGNEMIPMRYVLNVHGCRSTISHYRLEHKMIFGQHFCRLFFLIKLWCGKLRRYSCAYWNSIEIERWKWASLPFVVWHTVVRSEKGRIGRRVSKHAKRWKRRQN